MSILIISDFEDSSILTVEDWIKYYNNDYDIFNLNRLRDLQNLSLHINNDYCKFSCVDKEPVIMPKSIWFRSDTSTSSREWPINNFTKELTNKLFWEVETLKRSMFRANSNTRWLSNYESTQLDKLKVLSIAREIGLYIPDTVVTTSKQVLKDFSHKHDSIICKAAFENISYVKTTSGYLKNFVGIIDDCILESLPDSFFPSFFQKMIPKDFDVRVFYLNGKLYPMAIFSGSVDYRADYASHRNVPLKLPEFLENQIYNLMNRLSLNTGSLDFVKSSEDRKFYFLEVNPNGQFGMVSEPCNYYIEREIAKFLCHEE